MAFGGALPSIGYYKALPYGFTLYKPPERGYKGEKPCRIIPLRNLHYQPLQALVQFEEHRLSTKDRPSDFP